MVKAKTPKVTASKQKYLIVFTLALFVGMAWSQQTKAQQQKRIVQLSGVVIDTVNGPVPGVHVYIPKAGRGVTTNAVGFFSLPVLVGDSVVISSVGYKRQHYVVPETSPEYLTIVIPMVEDVTYLQEIVIMPYPTEEVFKEAVLALNLPPENLMKKDNLNEELLALMLKTAPMNGPMNQRYTLDQWATSQSSKYMPVTNPFLNPFNWARFFNSLKKKD